MSERFYWLGWAIYDSKQPRTDRKIAEVYDANLADKITAMLNADPRYYNTENHANRNR